MARQGEQEVDNFYEESEEPEPITISGKVESINRAGTGLKVNGEWANYTKPEWRGEPWHKHAVGDYVTLELDASGKFVKTVTRGMFERTQTAHGTRLTVPQAANDPGNGAEPVREQAMNDESWHDPTRTSIERQVALKVAGEIVASLVAAGVIQDYSMAGEALARLAKLGADVIADVQEPSE